MYQAAATKRANQPAGKNSTCLQSGKTENLSRMSAVVAPVVDDVENLRAQNSAQDHQNAQIPRIVAD